MMWMTTLLWIGLCAVFAIKRDFLSLELNNMGDFMTGVFAPAALFWFIAGVHFQRKEMKNSVAAFENQLDVLSRQYRLDKQLAESKHVSEWISRQPDLRYAGRNSGPKGIVYDLAVERVKMRSVTIFNDKYGVSKTIVDYPTGSMIHLRHPASIDVAFPLTWSITYEDEQGDAGEFRVTADGSGGPLIIDFLTPFPAFSKSSD